LPQCSHSGAARRGEAIKQVADGIDRFPSSRECKNMLGVHQGLGRFLGIGYTEVLVRRRLSLYAARVALRDSCRKTFKSGGAGDGA
jgi:hypothetical protein